MSGNEAADETYRTDAGDLQTVSVGGSLQQSVFSRSVYGRFRQNSGTVSYRDERNLCTGHGKERGTVSGNLENKDGTVFGKYAAEGRREEYLLEFGNRIGFIDWETQAGMIEKSREQLEELYVKSKSSMENKEKVITSIGILGGLMLVIILI